MTNVLNLNREQGHNVSSRYKIIKTGDLVSQFENEGYVVRELKVQKSRKAEYQGFGVHAIRMSHPSLVLNHEGLTPEIVLRNSYNGTSTFEIMMGVFRLVCSNGLVVGTTYERLKVRHVGDVMPKVLIAAEKIKSQTIQMSEDIKKFQSIQLTDAQSLDFAKRITQELIPLTQNPAVGPVLETIRFDHLLKVRRSEDNSQDLWSVLNRIQENALNGGLRYLNINAQGEVRNASTRQIRSIDTNLSVNRLVWDVATEITKAA
jgi:hypothetical protein